MPKQISETQFLCLYTSDFDNGALTYQSHIIAHRDNEKYLADNPLFKSFKAVTDVKERFAVWRDTYKQDYTTKGIIEENIQPYHIGKDKYTIADLKTISADDQQKKYHEFATILRQHNVSGRENAFDKLVNLFLCKLVDETENPHDLKFYWKGVAYDTHIELLDRLQQLYQAGMGKFLGEDITYINQNDVINALRFVRQNPDATQRAVWNLFVQQKFYTNNDFSLIDVHNEKLFYQNAEVLLKILQMWQDIRLTNPNGHHQFLGDMFEGFLDQGIKQSEGQYFTPMPICRFILMSLPLETLIKNSAAPPKAIDFACGAGHFLNELALQIQPMVERHKTMDISEYHKTIFGIEKEYRLSKVAKVSAFMYGQQDINICYGDALINQHSAFSAIQDNSFDLLVSNPPYSVRGFLETLPENERGAYALTSTIDKLDTNNSIETFFIERAKQLLKAGGVAAIILPSSILSNGNNTYVKTREILLQYFDIVAIAEFGSGTFGKTGTNTVTLFLRRKKTAPDTAEHYRERVEQWFTADDNQPVYQDTHLIARYAAHIGVAGDDFKTLLVGQPNDALLSHETFIQYRKAFDARTDIKNLKQQKKFKSMPEKEQQAEIAKRFLAFIQAIERDKLYHFVMAGTQPNPILIIKSPTDNKAQKQFLGYEWSDSKGNEGIKIFKDTQDHHLTPLYDETDRDDGTKLNYCISNNFDGNFGGVPESLSDYARPAQLVDMLDFSRVTFEKQISLAAKQKTLTISKWPIAKLESVAEIINGATPDTNTPEFWDGGTICWATLVDTKQKYLRDTQRKITTAALKRTNILPINTVIFSSRATIGEVCINKIPTATNQGYKNFVCDPSKVHYEYLYHLLVYLRPIFENLVPSGSKYKEINTKTIGEYAIPLPPLDIQQQIITECEAVDAEAAAAQTNINTAQQAIESAVSNVLIGNYPKKKLGDAHISLINPSKVEIRQIDGETLVSFVEMAAVGGSGFITNMVDRPLKELRKGSYTYFAENDIILAKITPCMENGKCAVAKGLTNGLGMGSSEFHVIRANPKNVLPKYLFALLNRQPIRSEAEKAMTGASGHRRVPASFYGNLQIPIPPIAEQKRLVAAIETIEQRIAADRSIIAEAPAKKQTVMQRYL
jgi:type I restriction enzyme M protein